MKLRLRYWLWIKKKIDNRIEVIEDILDADPGSEIIGLRAQAFKIMEDHTGDEKKIYELVTPLAKKEKELLDLLIEKERSQELIDELEGLDERLRQVCGKINCLK